MLLELTWLAVSRDRALGEIGKLLGAKWKELDDSEKKVRRISLSLSLSSLANGVVVIFAFASLTSNRLHATRHGRNRKRTSTM